MKINDPFSAGQTDLEVAAMRQMLMDLERIEDAGRRLNVDLDFDAARSAINDEIDERADALARWNAPDTETAAPTCHTGGGGNAGRTI